MAANAHAASRTPLRHRDYGFFGPGSPTWKVWAAPTALIGFQRSVVLEHFDPFLAAAVADMQGIYRDPHGRLDRTLAYFLTVAVADGRTAIEASEFLMRCTQGHRHRTHQRKALQRQQPRLAAVDPCHRLALRAQVLRGLRPGAAHPGRRAAGTGRTVVTAAELQTCKPADVPRSREEVRDYFAAVRPRLCTSERANEGMHYLLRTPRNKGGPETLGIQPAHRTGHDCNPAEMDARNRRVQPALGGRPGGHPAGQGRCPDIPIERGQGCRAGQHRPGNGSRAARTPQLGPAAARRNHHARSGPRTLRPSHRR